MAEPVALSWNKVAWRFAVHIIVGVAMFILVGSAAVGLEAFVRWMAAHLVPAPMVALARGFTYVLYGLDSILFLIYVLRTGWVHGRLMIRTKVA